MNRITWHHTGGHYTPNPTDLKAYHKLIDGDGQVVNGDFQISANEPGVALKAGNYAAHTRGLNSGNISISVCCMARAPWHDPMSSPAFPKDVQIDALIKETVRLCRLYGIAPGRRFTLSHAEVEPTLGVKQKNKWDFDYRIRTTGGRDPILIGDELRAEVGRAMAFDPFPAPRPQLTLRQGDGGPKVMKVQRVLGLTVDGIFGPKTRAAVVAFQRARQLLPDGNVSEMTWAALGL